jgi:cold shock protein
MKFISKIIKYVQSKKRNKMAQGTVKFFNETKGFGFITPTDNSKDIFVHVTGLSVGTKINDGDTVEYKATEGKKGLTAVDVSRV